MSSDPKMIPVRNKIPRAQAVAVGWKMAETLVSQWGLANAKKILGEASLWMKSETKRRKEP